MDISMPEVEKWKNMEIFCCYAREDQPLLLKLKKHLTPLQREGLITLRADINISAGTKWEQEVHHYLNTAQIILLLISPDFMSSDYCYSVEMQRALERHERGEARVIPVILRTVPWRKTPLGKLQALPKDANPITRWPDQDEALNDVSERLREVVEASLVEEEQQRQAKAQEPEVHSPDDHLEENIANLPLLYAVPLGKPQIPVSPPSGTTTLTNPLSQSSTTQPPYKKEVFNGGNHI